MTGELTIYLILSISIVVLISGIHVETARIVDLHAVYGGTELQSKSLKRDLSKELRDENNEFVRQYKEVLPEKRFASEEMSEISTKLNQQGIFYNLVRKNQERFTTPSPRFYQNSRSAIKESISPNVQFTDIPVIFYDKTSYSTPERYPSAPETGKPNHENSMNLALSGKLTGESQVLQGRAGKNMNNVESDQQISQMSSPQSWSSFCTSDRDDHIAGQKCGEITKTPRPKSVNEVYGLAVKAERKYEEGISTEKGGCVKFSEMSAELLSELERMEKYGNVKMEPRDEIPSVLKLLTSTECDQAASAGKMPLGVAAAPAAAAVTSMPGAANDRQGRPMPGGGGANAASASRSEMPAAASPTPERRPTRGAEEPEPAGGSVGDSTEDDEGAAGEVDAALQDIAVSLGGHPVLGRSSVD